MKNLMKEFEELFGLEEVDNQIFKLKLGLKEAEKSGGRKMRLLLEAKYNFKRKYLENKEYRKLYKEAKRGIEEGRVLVTRY